MAMAVEDVGAAAAVAAEAGIENQIREKQGTTPRNAPSVNWRTRALTRTGLAVARVRSLDPGDCMGKDKPLAEAKRGRQNGPSFSTHPCRFCLTPNRSGKRSNGS